LGEVRASVSVPLIVVEGTQSSVEGELQQILTWNSTGLWQLYESVSYRGSVGDESLTRARGDATQFASAYASLITRLSDTPELKVFADGLDQDLEVDCLADGVESRSRVMFQIRDDIRNEVARWTRCAEGTLEELTPAGAGPDRDASRVVQAAILTRDFSLGADFQSSYRGTLPFGTLAKGDDSDANLDFPLVFREGEGVNTQDDPAQAFSAFWGTLEPGSPLPEVDWSEQMVLVGTIGEVAEAGDSVEVRRVVEDLLGTTLVEIVERLPGDFCSPAARRHTPYHVVIAPLNRALVRFASPRVELVPCVP